MITVKDSNARILAQLAAELPAQAHQLAAAIELLDGGATVPFIARYRKEATGGLDDGVLRELEVRLLYLRELEERRASILESIAAQGKLDAALEAQIEAADSKQRLEDLYAPFKPRRRTKAQIAREAGIEPLVELLLAQKDAQPELLAKDFLQPQAGFDSERAVLNGARDILSERLAENADLLQNIRSALWQEGRLYSQAKPEKMAQGANFQDWFDFNEALRTLPSHRVLAMLRGRQQEILQLRVALAPEREELQPHPFVARIAALALPDADFSASAGARGQWLAQCCTWCWRTRMQPSFETEAITRLREAAETEAIRVFAANLKDLLLAAPAGHKAVMGLDPGIRTGVKVAVVDATGKLLDTSTIYPFEPRKDVAGSLKTMEAMLRRHAVALVAIGNGTASRETSALVAQLRKSLPELGFEFLTVSESGASVYSASELAAQEFPALDVSLRGAVSIARRLQDPLAELVKIDPKSIGVGQYQHDVNQRELARSLDAVVEDCVNAVGVDVNTASAPLLSRISGLNGTLARNIVQWRETNGAFQTRRDFLKVPRFGARAFEQAAGFLRIPGAANPLDASAVHPEAYKLAEQIILRTGLSAGELLREPQAIKNLSAQEFVSEQFGLPTVRDIFTELEKPGRDPRPEFQYARFTEGVNDIKDLLPGMELEGVVSNVANFGAFVDIGVHQDGLVHISELADRFVADPRELVRAGQTVKVRVLEVDPARKRIGLSMRKNPAPVNQSGAKPAAARQNQRGAPKGRDHANPSGAMAAAFAKLAKPKP